MRTLAALLVIIAGGCSDPVRDAQIAALGGEESGVAMGPEHRPGQPCVLCHSAGGPASAKPFAIAGTIFKTNKPGADGADGITVQFIDSRGGAPVAVPVTNAVGNFYVPLSDWPSIAFPVRVGIYKDSEGKPTQTMKSLIDRQASCNYCHRPNLADPTDDEVANSVSSAGQIYLDLEAK